MENNKLPIEAIRIKLGLSRAQMAEKMCISADRYNRVVTGESKMLAQELKQLHEISGIPYENIEIPS